MFGLDVGGGALVLSANASGVVEGAAPRELELLDGSMVFGGCALLEGMRLFRPPTDGRLRWFRCGAGLFFRVGRLG